MTLHEDEINSVHATARGQLIEHNGTLHVALALDDRPNRAESAARGAVFDGLAKVLARLPH